MPLRQRATGAFADGDAGEIADALSVIARARGMSQISEETGLTPQSLDKALSSEGNPEFATVLKVIRALGFRLHPEQAVNQRAIGTHDQRANGTRTSGCTGRSRAVLDAPAFVAGFDDVAVMGEAIE